MTDTEPPQPPPTEPGSNEPSSIEESPGDPSLAAEPPGEHVDDPVPLQQDHSETELSEENLTDPALEELPPSDALLGEQLVVDSPTSDSPATESSVGDSTAPDSTAIEPAALDTADPDSARATGSSLADTSSTEIIVVGAPSTEAFSADASPHTTKSGRHAHKKKKKRWRKYLFRTVMTLFLVIVLVAASTVVYVWHLNSEIHREKVRHLVKTATAGPEVATQNILLVGSTSRCALKVQNPAYGLCSEGVTGVNSDVVMILHLDPHGKRVSILSIPRDLFIPNARSDGAYKIDAALAQGPSQLVNAIEEDFGIPIQHYVELNFDSFANVVNALGGIRMYFPEPVYDAYSGLDVTTPGCHYLNGVEALQVVRARHLQYKPPSVTTDDVADWPYDPQSDLARIRRDHEFLRVLATTLKKHGLGNPISDNDIISAVVAQLEVDSGLSATNLANLLLTFHSVDVSTVPETTLPVIIDYGGSYIYQGGNFGDVEFPTEPADRLIVDRFLDLSTSNDTMDGSSLPKPSAVTVSVMNGTGAYNAATDTGNALSALGFHVSGLGDVASVGTPAETLVTYPTGNQHDLAAAEVVASSLNGAVVLAAGPTADGAEVTVTTGTNFSVKSVAPPKPSPSSTSTTSPGSSTTSSSSSTTTTAPATTTTTVATGPFTTPTPSAQSLEPWDPRSCTASGGEGP